jgi:hypothetical protein
MAFLSNNIVCNLRNWQNLAKAFYKGYLGRTVVLKLLGS